MVFLYKIYYHCYDVNYVILRSGIEFANFDIEIHREREKMKNRHCFAFEVFVDKQRHHCSYDTNKMRLR